MTLHELLLGHPLRLTLAAPMVALITMGVGGSASLPAVSASTVVDISSAAEQMLSGSNARLSAIAPPVIVLLTTVKMRAGEVHRRCTLGMHTVLVNALVVAPGFLPLARVVFEIVYARHSFNIEAGLSHLFLLLN